MSEECSQPTRSPRERVVVFLGFLTSEACRQACHQTLSPDRLAYEWCRLWFDEIYTPSTQYLDGIKGDQSEEAVARFQAGFTDDEQTALERFHRFLELRMDMLPKAAHQRASFPQNDAWDAVIRHATHLLKELDADPDALQQKLTGVVQMLTQQGAPDRPTDALHETFSSPPSDTPS